MFDVMHYLWSVATRNDDSARLMKGPLIMKGDTWDWDWWSSVAHVGPGVHTAQGEEHPTVETKMLRIVELRVEEERERWDELRRQITHHLFYWVPLPSAVMALDEVLVKFWLRVVWSDLDLVSSLECEGKANWKRTEGGDCNKAIGAQIQKAVTNPRD
ncbi:hypothetical protein CPB84DRAFT_1748587 [Gymnopilus junonius]|uniref:Uncharacterized protein n=1 Tax=Gymnopilus junonius TaxID=109634 RepID=A0A9P5NHY1_GYMJU|nr:hypothetical protein CPB84DRAFT_1748587 [Gymnopilus junonius]